MFKYVLHDNNIYNKSAASEFHRLFAEVKKTFKVQILGF